MPCYRMIVQVPKNQFVADVKTALCELIDRGLPKHLLVLAEVNKHSIRRTLVSSILRLIVSSFRENLFVFLSG